MLYLSNYCIINTYYYFLKCWRGSKKDFEEKGKERDMAKCRKWRKHLI